MPAWEWVLQGLNILVSLGILTLLFAMIFRFMPQADVTWKDVWTGGCVTAVMFELGKFLIGLYLGKVSVASSYAAAGSLVVVLIWVYYAAQVFLLGAEFTWVYANEFGSRAGRAAPPGSARHCSVKRPPGRAQCHPSGGVVCRPGGNPRHVMCWPELNPSRMQTGERPGDAP